MKGLLIKELFQLKNSLKTQGMSLVVFVFLGVMMKSTVYVGMMVTVLITNMILLTMGYDESCSWKRYAMTMPIRRRDLITVKYLLLYGLTVCSVLFTVIVGIPIYFIAQVSLIETFITAVGCALVALCSMSVNIMLCTKFGVEKARLMTVLSYLLPFGMVWGLFALVDRSILDLSSVSNATWSLLLLAAVAVIMAISVLLWRISCRIIEKQDL